jgi:hypothetical protein
LFTPAKRATISDLVMHAATMVHQDMLDWCRGRSALARIPLLLFFVYIGVRQFWNPMYNSLFGGINLGIHEGGHLLFSAVGEFICVAGGTFLQLFAPIASMVMFLKQRDYFAISVCFGWLSTNIMGVSVYMADAEKMVLPLVTVGNHNGGIVKHDWRFLFTKFGLLNQCEAIGWLTRQTGNISMLVCLSLGGWLLWQMYKLPPPEKPKYL